MSMPSLNMKIISNDEDVITYYKEACSISQLKTALSSSGFDLIVSQDYELDTTCSKTFLLKLGISCSPNFLGGYDLIPRSSIFKTPLRMSNSIGIIDNGYRGEICAPVDFLPHLLKKEDDKLENKYIIEKGTGLFQFVNGTRLPLKAQEVENLDLTDRGKGG